MRRTGLAGIAAVFALGVWLCAAPWASGQQPRGGDWTVATRNDVWIGAALAFIGFAGFFTTLAGRVRELYTDAARARAATDAAPGPAAATGRGARADAAT